MTWEYLAGFLDGDGTIKCYPQGANKTVRPRITFGQKERLVLDEIQTFLGTRLAITHSRNCHYLQICGTYNVHRILLEVLPFLIVKKQDATDALALLEAKKGT